MQIFLCGLPQLSFGHALGKGDKNWIGRCLSSRFCFDCTPFHSQSAEIQPFYGHHRFATSFLITRFNGFVQFFTVFLIFPCSAFANTTDLTLLVVLTWKQQWICAICPWICDQESFHISQVIVSASTEYFTSISIGYRAWALCFHYKFFNHKEFFPILTSCCATGYASSSSWAPSRKCCTSFTPLPLLFLTIFLSSFCSRDSLLIFLLWKFLCTVQAAKGSARRCSCARRAWS